MYGPLPADCELRNASALSVLSASAASLPPCAFTTFELTMPSDVFARIAGSVLGCEPDDALTQLSLDRFDQGSLHRELETV